ncbi:MAG: hypothetical protein KAJ03_09470, partial [Gammaproteobacteria bacterium]|nr:hypothetical protein [Gammaproteobacteria bacterium]
MTQEMQLIDMVVIVSLLALMLYLVSKCNGKTWVFHESVEASLQTLRDEQEPTHKDRVRTIIICGNCGAPYHVPE